MTRLGLDCEGVRNEADGWNGDVTYACEGENDGILEKAGFTTTKSAFVNAPVINELPLTLECTLKQVIDGSKFIGQIVNVSADDSILGDDGEIDLGRFTPIIFDSVHQGYYALGERVGNAFRDGAALK